MLLLYTGEINMRKQAVELYSRYSGFYANWQPGFSQSMESCRQLITRESPVQMKEENHCTIINLLP